MTLEKLLHTLKVKTKVIIEPEGNRQKPDKMHQGMHTVHSMKLYLFFFFPTFGMLHRSATASAKQISPLYSYS